MNYYKIITDPIDLQTIETKLLKDAYRSFAEFDSDVDKMWANSFKFNKRNNYMIKSTQMLQKFYWKMTNTEPLKADILSKKKETLKKKANKK